MGKRNKSKQTQNANKNDNKKENISNVNSNKNINNKNINNNNIIKDNEKGKNKNKTVSSSNKTNVAQSQTQTQNKQQVNENNDDNIDNKNISENQQNNQNKKQKTKAEIFKSHWKFQEISKKSSQQGQDQEQESQTNDNNTSGQQPQQNATKSNAQQYLENKQQKREQLFHLATQYMTNQQYDMAKMYFEEALLLNEHLPTLELENEIDIRKKLLICRLQCENNDANLVQGLTDADFILQHTPNGVQYYIMKAELHTRLCRFKEASECLLKAAEVDQPTIIPSVHLYLNQINEHTAHDEPYNENKKFEFPIDPSVLEKFFDELTIMSQQTLFSLNWNDIYDVIDSKLCEEMLPSQISSSPQHFNKMKSFLKKILDWNLLKSIQNYIPHFSDEDNNEDDNEAKLYDNNNDNNNNDDYNPKQEKQLLSNENENAQSSQDIMLSPEELTMQQQKLQAYSLIFLKVELAYILARSLWNVFPIPPKPDPNTKTIEESLTKETETSYFLENGLFACRDGYDFISAAVFEPSINLSNIFDITNKLPYPTLLLHSSWLYSAGFRLMHWLSNTPFYHVNHIIDSNNEGYNATDDDWQRFLQIRIHAHFAIDPELNEVVVSKDAQEDGKKFEDAMEKLVGKEKKTN